MGLKERIITAHRAGIREIVLPERNRKDELEIPEAALNDLEFRYVRHIREVFEHVLMPPAPEAATGT